MRSLLGFEAEHRCVPGVDRVRRLVRHPHREPAVLGNAHDAVVLHRDTGETLTDHRDLGDGVGTLARVAALLAELGGEAHVRAGVGEQQRRVGGESGGGRHDDRQGIDVGEHLLGGVVGLRLRFGDHGCDHVTDEAHPVAGEDRAVVVGRQHREALHRRHPQVVAGVVHRDDARHRFGIAEVDRVDRAVGDRRADERHVQHARLDEVVDVLAVAGEQRRVLQSQHLVAQDRTSTSHVKNPLQFVSPEPHLRTSSAGR